MTIAGNSEPEVEQEEWGASDMLQRFTTRAQRTFLFAQEEALRRGENYISTEHILLGLVRQEDSVAARLLDRVNIPLERIRSEIEAHHSLGDSYFGQEMQLTPRAQKVIDLAYDEMRLLGDYYMRALRHGDYIGTELLLLGLIREGDGLAARVLSKLGAELDLIRESLKSLLDSAC